LFLLNRTLGKLFSLQHRIQYIKIMNKKPSWFKANFVEWILVAFLLQPALCQLCFHNNFAPHPLKGNEHFQQIMVNDFGDVYLIEQNLSEIYRLDSTGKVLNRNGGFGWGTAQLNQPMDLGSSNGLDVIVVDRANHRLLYFDRQLNYLSQLALRQYVAEIAYPMAVATSRLGELFILLAETNQVLKIETLKKTTSYFGGFEYGRYALRLPQTLRFDKIGIIVVAEQDGTLLEYDRFGTPLLRIEPPKRLNVNDLIIVGDNRLLINNGTPKLLCYARRTNSWTEWQLPEMPTQCRLMSGSLNGNRIYFLLDNNAIYSYDLLDTHQKPPRIK